MSAIKLYSSAHEPLPMTARENISCWESAKKVQEISGKPFSFITRFYYLLIDLLAPSLGWVKEIQMAKVISHIEEIAKRAEFDEFINKNFIVLDTNVSHISDAELICLCENHYMKHHRVHNAQLIDRLCDEEKDLVLKEFDEADPPKSLLDWQLTDLKHTKVKIKGWDKLDKKTINAYLIAQNNCELSKANLKSHNSIRRFSFAALCLASAACIFELLPPFVVAAFSVNTIVASYFGIRAADRFVESSNRFLEEFEKLMSEIPERNRHLCQTIEREVPSARKTFVIAGSFHLMIPKRLESQIEKEWFDRYVVTYKDTMACIRKKKFAILCPRHYGPISP